MSKLLEQIIDSKLDEFFLREDEADIMGGDIQNLGNFYGIRPYEGGKSPFAFVYQAMKDVWDTGVAGVKNISIAAQGLLATALSFVNSTINPFASDPNYDWIMTKTLSRIRLVNRNAADVYQRNIDALTTGDTFGLMFLLNPFTMITIEAVAAAPNAFFQILNTVTGGLLAKNIAGKRRGGGGKDSTDYLPEGSENQIPTAQEIMDALKDPQIKKLLQQNAKVTHDAVVASVNDYSSEMVKKPVEAALQQSLAKNQNVNQNDIQVSRQALQQYATNHLAKSILANLSKTK